jgi:hypothetical protein
MPRLTSFRLAFCPISHLYFLGFKQIMQCNNGLGFLILIKYKNDIISSWFFVQFSIFQQQQQPGLGSSVTPSIATTSESSGTASGNSTITTSAPSSTDPLHVPNFSISASAASLEPQDMITLHQYLGSHEMPPIPEGTF